MAGAPPRSTISAMTRPVGDWQSQQDQDHLIRQREAIHGAADMMAYEAGKVRGSRGDIEVPPWMAHLNEIAPKMQNPEQFAAAHRYGQVESYVEHAHDLISDEFTPRAEAVANEYGRASNALESADTMYRSRAIMAMGGRGRGLVSPTIRRHRLAQGRVAAAQGKADALQGELQGRLDEVENFRQSLHDSPWKPHD